MFLYWKKRGAYELETLPSSMLGAEHYSWSSSLDVIHDLYGKVKFHSSLYVSISVSKSCVLRVVGLDFQVYYNNIEIFYSVFISAVCV